MKKTKIKEIRREISGMRNRSYAQVETESDLVNAILRTRNQRDGIPLVDIAACIQAPFSKDELAVLINHLTKFHATKK